MLFVTVWALPELIEATTRSGIEAFARAALGRLSVAHDREVFTKLGIRSRWELSSALPGSESAAIPA